MSEEQKAREDEVFDQKVSLDDLDAVAGGDSNPDGFADAIGFYFSGGDKDADTSNCIRHEDRNIYGGNGFPNCAATVEDGSHCGNNDACYNKAVDYQGLTDCSKAWR